MSTLPVIPLTANTLRPNVPPIPLTPALSTLAHPLPNNPIFNNFHQPQGDPLCKSTQLQRSSPMRLPPSNLCAPALCAPSASAVHCPCFSGVAIPHSPLATAPPVPLPSRPHSARIPPRLASETFGRSSVSNTMSGPRLRRLATPAAQPTIASRPQAAIRRRGRKADRVRLGQCPLMG